MGTIIGDIAGSIAGAYYGIPPELYNKALLQLPDEMIEIIHRLEHRCFIGNRV